MSIERVGGVDLEEVSFDTVYEIGQQLLPGLVKFGAAWVDVGPIGEQLITDLYTASVDFFRQDEDVKAEFSGPGPKPNVGRRPFKASKADGKPEDFESAIYWGEDYEVSETKRFPNGDRARRLMDGFRGFRRMSGIIVAQAILEMQEHYDPEHLNYSPEQPMEFHAGTLDQVNFMDELRILLGLEIGDTSSKEHEDADFLTAIWTSQPGLRALGRAITFPRRRVLLMAGSIATQMTGGVLPDGTPAPGAIPPLYHEVRFLGDYHSLGLCENEEGVRISEMEFAGPDATKPIKPFVTTKWNRDVDIQQLVIKNPEEQFDIGEGFVESSANLIK